MFDMFIKHVHQTGGGIRGMGKCLCCQVIKKSFNYITGIAVENAVNNFFIKHNKTQNLLTE